MSVCITCNSRFRGSPGRRGWNPYRIWDDMMDMLRVRSRHWLGNLNFGSTLLILTNVRTFGTQPTHCLLCSGLMNCISICVGLCFAKPTKCSSFRFRINIPTIHNIREKKRRARYSLVPKRASYPLTLFVCSVLALYDHLRESLPILLIYPLDKHSRGQGHLATIC